MDYESIVRSLMKESDLRQVSMEQTGMSKSLTRSGGRLMSGAMSLVKAGLLTSIVIDGVISPIYSAAKEGFDYSTNKLRELHMTDFGRGFSASNMAAQSERQKAVQAIQSANMNARAFLGQEAQFLH